MTSNNPNSTWKIFTDLDYASSDFGIEGVATTVYADAIASMRITTHATDEETLSHERSKQRTITQEASQTKDLESNNSDSVTIGVSAASSFNQEQENRGTHEPSVTDTSSAPFSANLIDEQEILESSAKSRVQEGEAIYEEQNKDSSTAIFTLLRNRLDFSSDALRFKDSREVTSPTTTEISHVTTSCEQDLQTIEAHLTSQDIVISKTTNQEVQENLEDVSWSEFVQFQEFAQTMWSNSDVTPVVQDEDTSSREQEFKSTSTEEQELANSATAQATILETQQVRASAQEVFTAARDLLKRLQRN